MSENTWAMNMCTFLEPPIEILAFSSQRESRRTTAMSKFPSYLPLPKILLHTAGVSNGEEGTIRCCSDTPLCKITRKAAVPCLSAQPCILSERPAADNHPTKTPH